MNNELKEKIDNFLNHEDNLSLISLWGISQGGVNRNKILRMISEIIPFNDDESINVLDMCSGPGDLGRHIKNRFENSNIDFVDRDYFLMGLCQRINEQCSISGRNFIRDGWHQNWYEGLSEKYQVIVSANALHWFDKIRLLELFKDFYNLLDDKGILIFFEPVAVINQVKLNYSKFNTYNPNNTLMEKAWIDFWDKLDKYLGYNYFNEITAQLPKDKEMINDDGIPSLEYISLLNQAGFITTDIIYRNRDGICITAIK